MFAPRPTASAELGRTNFQKICIKGRGSISASWDHPKEVIVPDAVSNGFHDIIHYMKVDTFVRGFSFQPALLGASPVEEAISRLANAGIEERGAIFTRREGTEFILDLIGYLPQKSLHQSRLLEPSFGNGDFLLPAVDRLLVSCANKKIKLSSLVLKDCIRAVELHRSSFDATRRQLNEKLLVAGLTPEESSEVLKSWLINGDFLLTDFDCKLTHVVGNPPYIRQELIPAALISEYRLRYETIFDRADIYIPFFECSLTLLDHKGVLGFICADRWMKNRYGGPLRKHVANGFHLRVYVYMVDTPAFLSEVMAYPAITIIANELTGPTCVVRRPSVDTKTLTSLSRRLTKENIDSDQEITELSNVVSGDEPWLFDAPHSLPLVRRLESTFPLLEEVGCSVGIGVATGADRIFIAPHNTLDVEHDRKLPLATTEDIRSGEITWSGLSVLNPFAEGGGLVALAQYPKLSKYLELHSAEIKKRHVSKKNPNAWYRTIDRIYTELVKTPKLLIPDIKDDSQIVYDEGRYYPHHNLYYVTSEEWDIRALQGVLLSGITRLFVETYSTRMRGGYLRFQAQHLRRIRVPRWDSVSPELRRGLRKAAIDSDISVCNTMVARLYNLSSSEEF